MTGLTLALIFTLTPTLALAPTLAQALTLTRYEWLPGMRELCTELQGAGVPMAAMSNYPAPWCALGLGLELGLGSNYPAPWYE